MNGFPQGSHDTLVDVAWLAENLGDVVLLDASITRSVDADGRSSFADGRAEFEAGHLPGARFADVFAAFSDPTADVLFTRPTAEQFVTAATSLGIHDGSRVVLYDRLTGAWAARIWWVFRSFGFTDVRVLDGGLNAWTAAGHGLETGPSQDVPAGDLTVREEDGWFVDLEEVQALSEHPTRDRPMFCALRASEFDAGHIAGSASLPYPDLLTADGTVDRDKAAAAPGQDRPVLYCGGGVNAAGLGLVLLAGGHPRPTVYDGSLNEWRARNLPLVVEP